MQKQAQWLTTHTRALCRLLTLAPASSTRMFSIRLRCVLSCASSVALLCFTASSVSMLLPPASLYLKQTQEQMCARNSRAYLNSTGLHAPGARVPVPYRHKSRCKGESRVFVDRSGARHDAAVRCVRRTLTVAAQSTLAGRRCRQKLLLQDAAAQLTCSAPP
jgi:hypothetical protein